MILSEVSPIPTLRRRVLCTTVSRECIIQTVRLECYGGLDWSSLDATCNGPSEEDRAEVRDPLIQQLMRKLRLSFY